MKRLLMTMAALTFSLALFVPLAAAKTMGAAPVAQDQAKEELDAYGAWYTAYKAQDAVKTLELGKAFVDKFPASKYVDFIKKDFPREYSILFNKAVQEKNVADIVRIGNEVLASNADNLDYIWAVLVQIRQNELSASPGNFAHSSQATDLAQRAIRLFEAGKTLTGVDPATFKLKVTLAYLHQTLAIIYDHDKGTDKALAEYEKAAELDPSNATYFFHLGRIHNDKYNTAAQRYEAAQKKADALPDADRNAAEPKPEVKAALDEAKAALAEVKTQSEAVINCWARYVALTADKPSEARTTILGVVTGLYKFRNNNSEAGLQKLLEDNRTSPAPVKMTPPVEPSAQPKPAAEPNAAVKPTVKKP
jgi:tetratricopeptide (TPR) repeat protein